ncbi:hypothetical protein OKA04_13285 [Luteolibacter flavescens]|uniref:Uncharacterized protein n=1 Tax=Luteolibacter flavescens TaxID=1859460 RepID=A0ABT3FQ69_9BACT|nr:hypothetical protein [Luteolibacter flavescens]MCW1885707.1 hypothetical protein [Luteolibacter flavescens]
MIFRRLLLICLAMAACGCGVDPYRHTEPFAGIERKSLTPESLVAALGQPGRILHADAPHKEGPPAATAYRYYFATRDDYPGAKTFYFDQGRWTGENTLGGTRQKELFRQLDPQRPADQKLISKWESEHPFTW